jgi:hypothetical protein
MTQPVTSDKSTALNELYCRITQIAEAMGGRVFPIKSSLPFPSATVAAPRFEDVPALQVDMPNDFRVEFVPSYPLSFPSDLSMRAKRTHGGLRKNDWHFNFAQDGWRRTQAPLSDDEIRVCLTPERPSPASY